MATYQRQLRRMEDVAACVMPRSHPEWGTWVVFTAPKSLVPDGRVGPVWCQPHKTTWAQLLREAISPFVQGLNSYEVRALRHRADKPTANINDLMIVLLNCYKKHPRNGKPYFASIHRKQPGPRNNAGARGVSSQVAPGPSCLAVPHGQPRQDQNVSEGLMEMVAHPAQPNVIPPSEPQPQGLGIMPDVLGQRQLRVELERVSIPGQQPVQCWTPQQQPAAPRPANISSSSNPKRPNQEQQQPQACSSKKSRIVVATPPMDLSRGRLLPPEQLPVHPSLDCGRVPVEPGKPNTPAEILESAQNCLQHFWKPSETVGSGAGGQIQPSTTSYANQSVPPTPRLENGLAVPAGLQPAQAPAEVLVVAQSALVTGWILLGWACDPENAHLIPIFGHPNNCL